MRLLPRLLWVFMLPVFPVVGCNEVTDPTTVDVQLTVAGEQMRLEGANICQTGTGNCVETVNGNATLQLPANREVSFTVEKQGYGSLLYPVVTGMGGTSANLDSNMEPREALAQQFTNLDSRYPPTDTGYVRIIFVPRFAGATVRLVDANGKAWYRGEEGDWSAELDATTEGETCCGTGGFVEVSPGVFQVEIGGTAQSCALSSSSSTLRGWPGEAPNTVQVPVQKGFETRTVLTCTPP